MKNQYKNQELIRHIVDDVREFGESEGNAEFKVYSEMLKRFSLNARDVFNDALGNKGELAFDDGAKHDAFFNDARDAIIAKLNEAGKTEEERQKNAITALYTHAVDNATHYLGKGETDFKDVDTTSAPAIKNDMKTARDDKVKGHKPIQHAPKTAAQEVADYIMDLAREESDHQVTDHVEAYCDNLKAAAGVAFSPVKGKGPYKFHIEREKVKEIAEAAYTKLQGGVGGEGLKLQIETVEESIDKMLESKPQLKKRDATSLARGRERLWPEVVNQPDSTVEGLDSVKNAILEQMKYGQLQGYNAAVSGRLMNKAGQEIEAFLDTLQLEHDVSLKQSQIRDIANMAKSMIVKYDNRRGGKAEPFIHEKLDKGLAVAKAIIDQSGLKKEEAQDNYKSIADSVVENHANRVHKKYGSAIRDEGHDDHKKAYDALVSDLGKLPKPTKTTGRNGTVENVKEKGQGIMNSKTAIGVTIGAAIVGGLVAFSKKVQQAIGKWTSYILGAGIVGAGIYGASRIANNSGQGRG